MGTPYQAVQHLNRKQAHPVVQVFLTLTSFAQTHGLPLMPHSCYSAASLLIGCERGYLIYYVPGYENHSLTGCAPNFLG